MEWESAEHIEHAGISLADYKQSLLLMNLFDHYWTRV